MSSEQQGAILAIALFAAFADGKKDDLERENIRRLAESLAGDSQEPNLTRLYQDVLLKRITLASAATSLTDSGERQLAYEMAVCVCDVDGRKNDAEIRFLTELKGLLELAPRETAEVEREVEAITDMVQYAAPAAPAPLPAGPAVITVTNIPEAELDKSILNHAILTGALELLPQSWASLAIIPLQVKMVYSIGKVHGVDLDQGHIKEFIAATGVGVTSQYLEKFCRKLLGGLLGKAAGKTFGTIGGAATGIAFSFATTYALGQLAKRYYAGGRQMNTGVLRDTFQNLIGPAKQMQAQYLPQIQDKAETLSVAQIMELVR